MADKTPPPHAPGVLEQIREFLGLRDLGGLSLEALERRTRRQLLDWAGRLGLTDLSRLTKDALATRVREALAQVGEAAAPTDDPTGTTRSHKFDLGLRDGGAVEHIPWGYGRDRVTAMVVDPERLFVYWEVTDDGIARAREALGPGGPGAWLNLRVYDVSGRIFDGTNAHDDFDQRVERDIRQWFFTIGKPTSTAVVEIGLLSDEGYFVRIARSGRAEFPRREPVAGGEVEWLTVRTARGPVDPSQQGGLPGGGGSAPPSTPSDAAPGGLAPQMDTVLDDPGALERWDWEQWFRTRWTEGGRPLEWRSPVPFSHPVESPAWVEESHHGTVTEVTRNGRTHVVYGPWQVIIRGLGAHAERRIVSTWELACTWEGEPASVRNGTGTGLPGAASEQLGGSERWRRVASERRFQGASERLHAGASERRPPR